MASQLVSKTIADDEPCVRCIHHPLMFSASKNKLKDEAFQPKWDERDASLLRLNYCDEEFCVAHGKNVNIKGSEFIGIATICQNDVNAVNEWSDSDESRMKYDGKSEESNRMKAHIHYAPMNAGDYVDSNIDVYTESEIDLPMHADLKYDASLNDDVKTRIRHYARKLAARAIFSKKV